VRHHNFYESLHGLVSDARTISFWFQSAIKSECICSLTGVSVLLLLHDRAAVQM
jgi:hypothetical protein